LSTVEKGSGSRPGAGFLHKIAQALGVTLADLVGREIVADVPGISPALREFALERGLPRGDVEMLAGIAFRGEAPRSKQRWEFIYRAIKSSADMDHEGS
jgi:transcriptional regulator with XRE-family HTH domain